MSKFRMNAGTVTAELEFFVSAQWAKSLSISWPDFRLEAEFRKSTSPGNNSIRLWYNEENIPARVDSYNLVTQLYEIPAPENLFSWIEKNTVENPCWLDINVQDIQTLRKVLLVIVSEYESYVGFHIPISACDEEKPAGEEERKAAAYYHFEDYRAVVFADTATNTVVIRFFDLNMGLAFCVGKIEEASEDRPARREVFFANGDRKLLKMDSNAYGILLDRFETQYFESENIFVTEAFTDWLRELYALLSQSEVEEEEEEPAEPVEPEEAVVAEVTEEAEEADAPAFVPVYGYEDEEEMIYQKIESMCYAQNSLEFIKNVIRALPDNDRLWILNVFDDAIRMTRHELKPGDVVMNENGETHLVVSNIGQMLQTLTKKSGRIETDCFPLNQAYPTGGHFDGWENTEEGLGMFI